MRALPVVTVVALALVLGQASKLQRKAKLQAFDQPESSLDEDAQEDVREAVLNHRKPRFFLRTTTTVTSTTTVSTSTACYTSNAAFGSVCSKRRKRRAMQEQKAIETLPKELQSVVENLKIEPSAVQERQERSALVDDEQQIESALDERRELNQAAGGGARGARLMFSLYGSTVTTTSSATATSYTTTTTFTLMSCFPSSIVYSACG